LFYSSPRLWEYCWREDGKTVAGGRWT